MFGKTASLSVSNLPDGASVSWSADEKNIVSLSPSGTGNANCTVKGVTAGKSVIVTAVVTDRRGNRLATPACTVTVTAASAPDITSSVASGGSVTFDESKFNSACTEVYGNKLNYVTFTLPSSSRGTLYYNYSNGTYDQKVSESTKYYYGGGVFKSALSKVSFVAEPDYSGKVTISYSAVDTSGYSYTGAVAITVSEPTGSIEFSGAQNEVMTPAISTRSPRRSPAMAWTMYTSRSPLLEKALSITAMTTATMIRKFPLPPLTITTTPLIWRT